MRFVIGLSLALAVWVGAAAPAQAGQTTVVGTGTSASCSLTALKLAVLTGANPLLVTFNCGASPVVIPVTSSITFNAQIADITIDGGAPGLITLSGSTERIIDQRLQENLTVKNLTFTGGSATGTCSPNNACAGGAIYNPSGILTVIDSTFTNNSAGPSMFEQHKGGQYTAMAR